MGAWIEIFKEKILKLNIDGSHPLWVRGLKSENMDLEADLGLSHPLWVRGLKF